MNPTADRTLTRPRRAAWTFVTLFTILALPTGASAGGEETCASANGDAGPADSAWLWPGPAMAPPAVLGQRSDTTFITADMEPEGDMPRNVVFTPNGTEVVIVHRDTDNVTFFDVATRIATHTVPVGDFPVDVAVTPDGQYAVVPNVFDHTVTLVDVPTHTVAATIPITGEQPFRVALTPDSNHAIVAVITDGSTSRFSVIDLNLQSEVFSFPSAPQGAYGTFWSPETGAFGNLFSQFALAPDGGTIVLPDAGNARVMLYDWATGTELADLATEPGGRAVDVSLDGTTAVVLHGGNPGYVTEIDLISQIVTGSFPIAEYTYSETVRVTPDKTHAIAPISNNVVFVDLTTGAISSTVYTGSVGEIEITYDGQYAFVSNFTARVIDIASQTLVKSIDFAACVDSAVSPVENCAVALNNRFRENIHFYYIDGAAGFFEGYAVSGEPEEGDGTYAVDISTDGTVAVACNVMSENVLIIDVPTDTVRSYVNVGDRPKEVRITPDGNYAVVCAMDANDVQIIDLSTDTLVKSLYIYRRPGRVRISPDSQWAYVLNVAGTDMVSFIHLDGADSSIEAQLSAGQTGTANGYSYTETSGIELSADGSTLAVCDSFNDLLRLYDTATQTQVGSVAVGDFPIRVAFSPNGTRAYVTNAFGDSVSVVEYSGGSWLNVGTVPSIDMPLTVDVDATDSYVYVGNASTGAGIRVIDSHSLSVVKTLLFADGYPRDSHMTSAGMLYVASTGGELVAIEAAGSSSAIVDTWSLSGSPADLAFHETGQIAVLAHPPLDGVAVLRLTPLTPGDMNCDGTVDFFDIDGFVQAVIGGEEEWPYPDCPWLNGDINGDGTVSFFDIDGFVELVVGA